MKSLRVKLIAPFLLGTLLLTLILSFYTYRSTRNAVEDSAVLVSEARAGQVASSMSLLFRSLLSAVQNMVVDPHVTDLFSTTTAHLEDSRMLTAEWLEIYAQSNEYYRDIFIVNAQGRCIVSSNPGQLGMYFGDKPYVRLALGGMINFGESSVGQITKRLSTMVAGPIDNGGSVVGALVMTCDLPQIVDYSELSDSGPQAVSTAIIDPTGMVMAHKDKALMNNAEVLYPSLYQELVRVGKQGAKIEYEFEGQMYIGYGVLEPTSKWVVFCSGLEEQVFAPAYRVGLTVFGISVAVLGLIYFVIIRFANGILSSLLSLIQYARKVSEGNVDLKLGDATRSDELGILHTSLQKLVEVLETMLARSQEASKMKGEFLANMSHEIRTPLNAVIGLSHLSLRDAGISGQQKSNLEQIQIAAKSLLGIINDILDISKIESGKLQLDSHPFNFREHVVNTLAIHRIGAENKALDLDFEYDSAIPECYRGDALRIGQVLNNLLSNAVKFTLKGGIKVSVAGTVPEDGGPVTVRVSVADSGIGMSEENMSKLFQPFSQADASITRRFGGTGLGLAISQSLVQMMGGKFSVESEQGKGSVFSFTMLLEEDKEFCRRDANRPDAPSDDGFTGMNLDGKRILIVEDNVVNQMILQELVAPTRADVQTANNGEEALEALKDQSFDLIFMDMQMPVMDGLQATLRIRETYTAQELPIIAVTANAMKEDVERGLTCGMNDYITKPIEPAYLASILGKWLSS